MFCTKCGRQLKEDQKFCTNCGSSVEGVASQTADSRVAVPPPATITAGRPPSWSGSAPAENPASVSVREVPRPIPVAALRTPTIEQEQKQPDWAMAPRKAIRLPLIWVGIGLVVLVSAVTLILYLRSSRQATVPDAEIEKSIQAKFAADPDLSKYALTVQSHEGVVTLLGSVNSSSDRSTAARLVLQHSGVKTLVDDLILTATVAAPKLAGDPSIASVTPIMPQATQDILIRGSGFGSQPAYEGDSPFLILEDVNRNWRAGCRGRAECGPGDNSIILRVSSWTDSEIRVEGFGGRYAANTSFRLEPGDEMKIWVWNTQTGTGPATYNVTVGPRQAAAPAVANSSTKNPDAAPPPRAQGGTQITSVTPIRSKAWQTIVIKGTHFGTNPPFNGCADFIRITDVTANRAFPSLGPWGGCANPILITSWNDTEIVIEGFPAFQHGQDAFTVGDTLKVEVRNPQQNWAQMAWSQLKVAADSEN